MRHLKDKVKLGRTTSHKRCLMANMLKALITQERIETTEPKAKELRRHAERMVTLAKRYHEAAKIEENKSGTPEEIAKAVAAKVALQRLAKARMMIRLNTLTAKEKKDGTGHNVDREVLGKLFKTLGPRFMDRKGGYTRIMKHRTRVGDGAALCFIEYVDYVPTQA